MSSVSALQAQLSSYLSSVRVKKGEPFTHTTKSPAATYYIGDEEIESFTTLYCNAISKGVRPTVTEKPGNVGPLRFDFDFKTSLDDGTKRKYTEKIVEEIIDYIQSECRLVLAEDTPNIDEVLRCVLLEKKEPRVDEGIIKDGFHLHFPNLSCEGWLQDDYLKNKITEKMLTNKTWDGIKYMDGVEKFIDSNMARKPWLMYGSAKAEGAEPFLATKFYGPKNPKTGKLVKLTIEDMFKTELEGRKSRPAYYLPRFLSIRGYDRALALRKDIESKRSVYRAKKAKRGIIVRKRNMEDVMEDVKTIKEGGIMDMLSDSRADEYNSWLDVGWTLFNIGQGCEEMLQIWIDFSRRSVKFVEGECEEKWSKMEMRDKTIGSLFAMARSDSPDAYKAWKDLNINNHIEKSLFEAKPNEWDVAQVVLKLYKDRFVCADAKKDIWYEFVGHRWQFMDDNVTLRKLLATEVVNLYYNFKLDLAKKQVSDPDESSRAKLEAKEAKCRNIITALKECKFQERLIKMCKVVFHDPLFLKKIDENKMLFVCENGVIDFELMAFRDGRPDDYCTLSCNVHYPKNASVNDDEYIEVMEYLKKVFPNPNIRAYFLDTSCAAMEGGNVNKTFIVGTGSGDNAKTVTYSFLEMAFGEYCIKFPRELFVVGKGNSSGAARPELARVRGKRLAIVSEIAKTETLNIGILKELTGNDSFFTRGIYEKGTEIRPMFTLMMQCNEPPKVPGHDDATWNRIRVIDYESRFVKKENLDKFPVPDSLEEQFKMKRFLADNTFMRKLPELCPHFIWILFNNYKDYKKRGLVEPSEVRGSTSIYRQQNDIYVQYVSERIVMASKEEMQDDENKEKYFLKLTDLHADFTTWYHENHSAYAKEKFNKITLKHEFSKRFPGAFQVKGRTQGWYGYAIVPEEDDNGTFGSLPAAKNVAVIKQILENKQAAKAKTNGTKESKVPIPGTKALIIDNSDLKNPKATIKITKTKIDLKKPSPVVRMPKAKVVKN